MQLVISAHDLNEKLCEHCYVAHKKTLLNLSVIVNDRKTVL